MHSITFPRAYVRAVYTSCGLRKNSTQGNRTRIFIPPRRYGISINDPVPGTNENTTVLRPLEFIYQLCDSILGLVSPSEFEAGFQPSFARTALYAGHTSSIVITDLRLNVLSLGPRIIWGHVRYANGCFEGKFWPEVRYLGPDFRFLPAPIYGTDVIRGRRETSSAVIRTSSTPLHGIVVIINH